MDELKTHTTSLTKDELDSISKDPKNVMYEYTCDKVSRVKSVDEVKYLLRETKKEYDSVLSKNKEFCDNRIRRELMETFPQLADFSKTHPLFFKMVTDRNSTSRDYQIAFMHLNLRREVELGNISHEEATQKMNMMVLEQCKTGQSYEDYQKNKK